MVEAVLATLAGVVIGFALSVAKEAWDSRGALRFDVLLVNHFWAKSTFVDVDETHRAERWAGCAPADPEAILFVAPLVHAWNASRAGDAVRRAELLVTTDAGMELKPIVARRADGQDFVGANIPAFGLGAWVFWFDLEREPRSPLRERAPEELFRSTYDAQWMLRLLTGKGKQFDFPLRLGAALPRPPGVTFQLVDVERL